MNGSLTGYVSAKIKDVSLILVLLGFVSASIWAVLAVPEPTVDLMLKTDIRKQAELWKRRVIMNMIDSEESFETGIIQQQDADFLTLLPGASDVYRFSLLNSDGMVFWSTREQEIGTSDERPYFENIISEGNTYFEQGPRNAQEIDGLHLHAQDAESLSLREVAKVVMPLMHNGHFDGAIEFYSDVTDMRKTFITRVRLMIAALTTIGVLAMSVVVRLIYKSNRARLNRMKERNNKERDLLGEQLRLSREVQLLGELNEWLQSSRSLDELFDMVARFMTHILPNAEGSVYVYSNSRDVLDGCASWNGGTHKDHIHPEECWGLRRGRTYEYGISEVDFVCEHAEPHDDRVYFCFPILAHGETVGLMHLRSCSAEDTGFTDSKKLAQMCAEQISMAIANVRMRDQLHDQSVRDPLTGLFNRRHMTETLRKCIGSSQHSGKQLSLVSVDVDHFKKFNDNHGHDAGDMVLRAVGSALEQACDGDEVACRPGGEEFTLILPGLSPDDVMTKAELVRKAIEAVAVRYGEKTLPRITISLGVAHYPAHGTMPQDLLRASDEALYDAKARGRNQVRLAESSISTPRHEPDSQGPPSSKEQIAAE